MDYYHIGFFPKLKWTRAAAGNDFPAPKDVVQICSVSTCIVKGLSGFDYPEISENCFNQYGGFNRLEDSLGVIPFEQRSEYELFAYAVPEFEFENGQKIAAEIGCVDIENEMSVPPFELLGFDVVESKHCNLGHSPLTCNGQAGIYAEMLNEYCLIREENDAIRLAQKFSIEQPEPGNYIVVQVWVLRA